MFIMLRIISWNCRGAKHKLFIAHLRRLIKSHLMLYSLWKFVHLLIYHLFFQSIRKISLSFVSHPLVTHLDGFLSKTKQLLTSHSRVNIAESFGENLPIWMIISPSISLLFMGSQNKKTNANSFNLLFKDSLPAHSSLRVT